MLHKPITEKMTSTVTTKEFRFAQCSMQGWRKNMEDAHTLRYELAGDRNRCMLGVFDGHNGQEVAEMAAEKLPIVLANTASFKQDKYPEALAHAICAVDDIIDKNPSVRDSGTTANIVLLKPGKIFCANTGDSRAVLCRDGKAIALSRDHRPGYEREKRRIVRNGGSIEDGRVGGVLAVCRALGDFELKSALPKGGILSSLMLQAWNPTQFANFFKDNRRKMKEKRLLEKKEEKERKEKEEQEEEIAAAKKEQEEKKEKEEEAEKKRKEEEEEEEEKEKHQQQQEKEKQGSLSLSSSQGARAKSEDSEQGKPKPSFFAADVAAAVAPHQGADDIFGDSDSDDDDDGIFENLDPSQSAFHAAQQEAQERDKQLEKQKEEQGEEGVSGGDDEEMNHHKKKHGHDALEGSINFDELGGETAFDAASGASSCVASVRVNNDDHEQGGGKQQEQEEDPLTISERNNNNIKSSSSSSSSSSSGSPNRESHSRESAGMLSLTSGELNATAEKQESMNFTLNSFLQTEDTMPGSSENDGGDGDAAGETSTKEEQIAKEMMISTSAPFFENASPATIAALGGIKNSVTASGATGASAAGGQQQQQVGSGTFTAETRRFSTSTAIGGEGEGGGGEGKRRMINAAELTFPLSSYKNLLKNSQLTAIPDVIELDWKDQDEFIVLACDGVWDMFSSQEVVDMIRKEIQKHSSPSSSSSLDLGLVLEDVLDRCLAPIGMGNGTDNFTIMIVFPSKKWKALSSLEREEKQKLQQQQQQQEEK